MLFDKVKSSSIILMTHHNRVALYLVLWELVQYMSFLHLMSNRKQG